MKHWMLLLLFLSSWASADKLTFHDQDMVVLLGNTVIERAQKHGHLETALTLAAADKNIRVRNLGWSGDTVYGHARSYFGPPQEGFERLQADLTRIKPNVIVVCYGAVAAFEGKAGLPHFIDGYNRLLDMISQSANPREIVLVSPPPAETHPAPMPDMAAHNQRLVLYRDAIAALAKKRNHRFADLFKSMEGSSANLTENGLHYSEKGYSVLAPRCISAMGLTPPSAKQLSSKPAQQLREKIIAKNKAFFFKWRPANETYLRLFRKHEQGNNVKELEEFDPIIKAHEAEINALKISTLNVK